MSNEVLFEIPHNAEAERTVLGVLMTAPERVGEAAERLDAADFFVSMYRKIFSAILQLDGERRPIDAITIQEVLADDKELADAGGVAFISGLDIGVHKKAALPEYCRIIREASVQRAILKMSARTTDQIGSKAKTADVLESLESDLSEIRDGHVSSLRGAIHISEVSKELVPILERASDGEGRLMGTPTGFTDIDALTAGWIPGELVLLAARPSVGKTALAIDFSLRQLRAGNPVAFFSLEMSRASIMLRMVCREAGVDNQRLRCGQLPSSELKKIVSALARVSTMPLWIDDTAALRAAELRWRLRALSRRHDIKFAVVDYVQLLRSPGRDRFESVTNSSIELKAAAKELGQASSGTLLALAQLNRAGAGDRPRLEHLRESGQLEQDGDVVFLLSDAERTENGQVQPSIKILDIAKQRNGPCNDVRLVFLPAIGGFEQVART